MIDKRRIQYELPRILKLSDQSRFADSDVKYILIAANSYCREFTGVAGSNNELCLATTMSKKKKSSDYGSDQTIDPAVTGHSIMSAFSR
jgi:hypothetical protein